PVQPVGRPVRRHIAAVTPDRTELHAADRLPYLAAEAEILARENSFPAGGDHRFGHGWRVVTDLLAGPEQRSKGNSQQYAERRPELLRTVHPDSPFFKPWCNPTDSPILCNERIP